MKMRPAYLIITALIFSLAWSSCSKKPEAEAESPPRISEDAAQEEMAQSELPPVQDVPSLNETKEDKEEKVAESAEMIDPPVIPTLSDELRKICQARDSIKARFPTIRDEVLSPVLELYQTREYAPFWFPGEKLNQSAGEVVEALELATSHALDARDYLRDPLQDLLYQLDEIPPEDFPLQGAWTELILTLSVTSLAYDLQRGVIPHQEVTGTWESFDKYFNLETLLTRILEGEGTRKVLQEYPPPHPGYQALHRALDRYRKIAAAGGWQPIDPVLLNGIRDREMETGSYDLVPLLRDRLAAEGYEIAIPDDPEKLTFYDDSLRAAVRTFQARRGLDQDGIVGPNTLKALNVPVEALIEKIVWSLDRWRWLPDNLGDRHILVNVPEFTLRAYSQGEKKLQMGVIVGDSAQGTWTPIFSDQMEYVIFRPYWNVPQSIIKGELLPEIKKDRGYIRDFNYELVDRFSEDAEVFRPSRRNIERVENGELKIRQTSGPYNALGLVKFIFPNRHSVYLHDTNQRSLFVHSKRDFSHGCIRVQQPEELARYALPSGSWTMEKIRDAMADKKRQMVPVGSPIPIYIFYLTAYADEEDGPIGFFEDLYHYDAKMAGLKPSPSNPSFQNSAPQTATHP